MDSYLDLHYIRWEDGDAPPSDSVASFLRIFNSPRDKDEFIAVSCPRGLSRAPTLAGIALIERGMRPVDAITSLRKINPRFITERQKAYLLSYRRRLFDVSCHCLI